MAWFKWWGPAAPAAVLAVAAMGAGAAAQQPIVARFSADPAPHVFNGRLYVYATDDASNSGTYWDSTTWRLYSTTDMKDWKDEGAFLGISVFKWAQPTAKAWAPDAVTRHGKFFFYAPVGGDKIGVAVADRPEGPFRDARTDALIDKARDANAGDEPIDPQVLIDDDGQAYLCFGTRKPKIVKLGPDMTTLAGPIEDLEIRGFPADDPKKAYGEAPFLHKRDGVYYFSFSTGWPGQIAYATATRPMGPYTYRGVMLDYLPISTNHQGLVTFMGRHWLFFHDKLLPGGGDFRRSITFTEFNYAPDGSLRVDGR